MLYTDLQGHYTNKNQYRKVFSHIKIRVNNTRTNWILKQKLWLSMKAERAKSAGKFVRMRRSTDWS